MKPHPDVTRWAPLLYEAFRLEGWSDPRDPETGATVTVTDVVAASLGVIHGESRGQHDLGPNGPGAFGLTQILLKFASPYSKGAGSYRDLDVYGDPLDHLREYARQVVKFLPSSNGHVLSALFKRGSGGGAVKHWVETGDCTRYPWICSSEGIPNGGHLLYFQRLATSFAPAYGRWLLGWIEAGSPTQRVELAIKARSSGQYRVPAGSWTHRLAVHGAPFSSASTTILPYSGLIWAGGKNRMGTPGAGVGTAPARPGAPAGGGALVGRVWEGIKGGVRRAGPQILIGGAALVELWRRRR